VTLRWAAVEGGAVALLAVACTAYLLWLPATRVDEADYRGVARVLAAEARPGDAVLLYPWWTERARAFVPDGLPVVGYLDSDTDDLVYHPRVWLLAQPNLPRSDLRGFLARFGERREPMGPSRSFGNLELRLYSNGRYRPRAFSGEAALDRASVYLEAVDGRRAACRWNGRAHECPNGHVVEVSWREVRYRPLRCLAFDAPGGGTKLVLELSADQTRGARRAALQAGLIWEYAAYKGDVSSTEVGLDVAGDTSTVTIPPGEEGVHRLERAVPPEGAGVRAWVRAENPRARHVCVVLDGFGGEP
jgi:hypothetical protein